MKFLEAIVNRLEDMLTYMQRTFGSSHEDELQDPHETWFLTYPCDDAPIMFHPEDASEYRDLLRFYLNKDYTFDWARMNALIQIGYRRNEDERAFYNAFENVVTNGSMSYYDALAAGYAAVAALHADDKPCSDGAEKAEIMRLLDAELEELS